MPCAPASAPQPAHGADVLVQIAPDLLQGDTCSAPQPAQYVDRSEAQPTGYGELCMFLFYNVGWQAGSKYMSLLNALLASRRRKSQTYAEG